MKTFFAVIVYNKNTQTKMSRSMSDYKNAPSLYEIRCENGEIDEEEHGDEIFDCGDYYMVGYYKYDKNFPQEWALSHLSGTGPEECENCCDYGSKNDVFCEYCLNCAKYDYNGERGPGAGHNDTPFVEDDKVPVEPESERLARMRTQLLECASDLDFVFQIANGKVDCDDPVALEFFGVKDE